jgi:hypothetical protein
MTHSSATVRALITYGIVLPLAILLGYMAVGLSPDNPSGMSQNSLVIIGIVVGILSLPLLIRWHHALLYLGWNASAVVFFLPGRPELWMFMALVSFSFMLFQRALNPEVLMRQESLVLSPLLFILIVVIATAYLRGGIHLGSLGSDSLGGRKYIYMIAAVIGFIAMGSYRVPDGKAGLYVGCFFLSALTNVIGDLVHFVPWLSFLLLPFPMQVGSSFLDTDNFTLRSSEGVFRDFGITTGCLGVLCFILTRNSLVDLLKSGILKKTLVLLVFAGSLAGGYRTAFVLIVLTFFVLFWVEKLYRTKYVLLVLGAFILCVPLSPFGDKLPASIQRSVSVVPFIHVSPEARNSAVTTSEWRLNMWKVLLPQVPQYLWLGKGFEANTSEFISTIMVQNRGGTGDSEAQMMAGDYHNGPLSVIIPFGIWGVIGWLWFFAAGVRALYLNYRHGSENFRTLNAFLLAHFIAKIIMFFFVFGSSYSDLAIFCGLLALSISVNGGILRPVAVASQMAKSPRRNVKQSGRLAPSLQR